jgi:hypothetical protein
MKYLLDVNALLAAILAIHFSAARSGLPHDAHTAGFNLRF